MSQTAVRRVLTAAPWSRFVTLGDSVAVGDDADPVPGLAAIPWPRRIADALREACGEVGFVNLAEARANATSIRRSQLGTALDLCPDLTAVSVGGCELFAREFDAAGFARDLDGIFGPLTATGATVVCFTYPGPCPRPGLLSPRAELRLRERMDPLHRAIVEVAARHGVLVVDIFAAPEGRDPAYWNRHALHPNARGHLLIAEATLQRLAAHLLASSGPPDPDLEHVVSLGPVGGATGLR